MKKIILCLLLFSFVNSAVAEDSLYSVGTASESFNEYMELSKEELDAYSKNQLNAALSEIFLHMEPSDFNTLMLIILNRYYESPDDRFRIRILLNLIDHQLLPERLERSEDTLSWSAADGAINGVFLLTLVHMGSRLSKTGITKSVLEKASRILFGKVRMARMAGAESAAASGLLRLPGRSSKMGAYFFRSRHYLGSQLGATWAQYLAAGGAGALAGGGLHYLRNLETTRYSPRNYMLAVDKLLMAEAAVASCEIYYSMQEAIYNGPDLLARTEEYLRSMDSLVESNPILQNSLSSFELEKSRELLGEFYQKNMQHEAGACEIRENAQIIPSAVQKQLLSLRTSLQMEDVN